MADSQEQVYLEFLEYDWDSFQEFQDGLVEILDGYLSLLQERDPTVQVIPPAEKQQLIDQAKLFFYCTKTGNILNLDEYYDWKRNNGGKITLVEESEEVNAPENRDDQDQEAPYSSNYQQLVDLIVAGKPVPGIKEIPDTVLSDQGSKLEAKARVKPWEQKEEGSADEDVAKPDIQEITT